MGIIVILDIALAFSCFATGYVIGYENCKGKDKH